jgi:GNAT superfamily N-acetyltransferase
MNKFMMLKYMTLGVVVFYVLFIIYFKLSYPFWSKQPIFYYHDVRNLLYPKGIIETSLPNMSRKINKSIDYKNARTLTSQEIANLEQFLENNYMTEHYERYTPTNNDVMDHLLCRNMPSNVSLYYDNMYGELIGSMTSAYKTFIKPNVELQVGYVDNLCVDKNHRGKNIAGQLIENHYVRERYQHKTAVYMFKHEGISRPFVPLTIYNTYFYKLDLFHKIITTQNYLSCIQVTSNTSYLLYDLQTKLKKSMEKNTKNNLLFQCVIMDGLEHLMYLIKKQHLHIFCLVEDKTPLAFYFFKNIYTTYNGDKSIECFSCIKFNPKLETNKFLLGFYLAIDAIKAIDKYKILLLENISDTHYLIQNIKQSPYHSSKYYYYMYNYAMKPVSAKHIVIL